MADDETQRRTWLRWFFRLAWVGCCVALLTTVTVVGSQFLSNRRLMVLTKPTKPNEMEVNVTWERRWLVGLDRWIGVDNDIALSFRPTELLVQGRDITDAKIVEILQASSGLRSISVYNRNLPAGALELIATRNTPQEFKFRLPVIDASDAALLATMRSLKHVDIGQFERQPRQNDWSWLRSLPALETLDVTLWGATEADVIALSESPAARDMSLEGDGVTDATLSRFCDAPRLRRLDIGGPSVRLHFGPEKKLPASLTDLDMQLTKIDDQSLDAIAGLPALRRISIHEGELSDVAMKRFAELPALSQLWLEGLPKVTDEGVQALTESNSLTEVIMKRCGTTPTAIVHLNAIPNWTEFRYDGVEFRRAAGAPKAIITPESAAEVLSMRRRMQQMQNEVHNVPGILRLPPPLN